MMLRHTHYGCPSVNLTLIGLRVGMGVAKAVLSSLVRGQLTPELLGEAIMSSSDVRSHVQAEALRLIAVRVSMRSPRRLAWLVRLIVDYYQSQSTGDALRTLGRRTLLYHVTAFGVKGTLASALAAAAVQLGLTTCWLATSNVRLWHRSTRQPRMSIAQYRYDTITTLYTAAMTVIGGGVGAALGSMLLPGFGTALGSILCSTGGGCLPSYLREKKGPDDTERTQQEALRKIAPLPLKESDDGFVEVQHRQKQNSVGDAEEDDMELEEEEEENSTSRRINKEDEEDGYVVLQLRRKKPENMTSVSTTTKAASPDIEGRATCVLPSCSSSSDNASDDVISSAKVAVAGPQSQLCFTRCVDVASDDDEATEKENEVNKAEGERRVMKAKVECIEGKSWHEIDALVDGYGEDEVVLLFAVNDA